MAQEEKAKAYDEALERARDLHKDAVDMGENILAKQCEIIFPELKESEDERIRKEIISALKWANHKGVYDKHIAWLEKQGEQKSFDYEKATIQQKDFAPKQEPKFKVGNWVVVSTTNGDRVVQIASVEYLKNGNPSYITTEGRWFGNGTNARLLPDVETITISKSKAVSEEVKQKFKVGDWIVQNDGSFISRDYRVCKITNVENGNYAIESIYGYKGYNTFETFEKAYHPWTIQDAKEGDILVYEGEIFLIKDYTLWHRIVYHCCYDGKNLYKNSFYDSWKKDDFGKVHPATKEQRELLLQKMKEANYEWDAEKKELKEIEPKFKMGDCVIKKRNSDINDFGYFIITDITDGKYWYNDRIICGISEQDEWELCEPVKQNSAWSEEDEKMYKRVYKLINSVPYCDSRKEYSDWLKSLRYKHTWKPSNEQMVALDDINNTWEVSNEGQWQELINLYNDLKKLQEE